MLKLPAKLLDELGGQDALSDSSRKRRIAHHSRKELRKADRAQKKMARNEPPPVKRQKTTHQEHQSEQVHRKTPHVRSEKQGRKGPEKAAAVLKTPFPQPRSILKDTRKADSVTQHRNSPAPPPPLPRVIKHKSDEEDEEIAALEKKLGIKGRKRLPQSFKDDGLDELLEGLDDEDVESDHKRSAKAQGIEWLVQKRRAARGSFQDHETRINQASEDEDEDDDGDDNEDSSEYGEEIDMDDTTSEMRHVKAGHMGNPASTDEDTSDVQMDDEFDGFDSDASTIQPPAATRSRENPYVPPASNGNNAPAKYIPPSLRKPASSENELLIRLRRQVQGLVNRLTEANLISILADVEKLYRDNARQHVTSTLTDLLLIQVCEPTSLPDTSIIVPAGFISAVYKVIGTDFGAQVTERIVELFDGHYRHAIGATGHDDSPARLENTKETSNLITLLSELYNFQVVGSKLMFDYIRVFLGRLSELNAELLLKLIRISGPQLRQDDPSALKDIVAMLRPAISSIGEENLSVRTKFMIETINNLKNNRMKTGSTSSAVTSEHTIRMKKTLGTLNTRSIKASEPLRIGLKDIQESDKKGKWWLVGARWSGTTMDEETTQSVDQKDAISLASRSAPVVDNGISDLIQLASEQRMNTDIRRAIFITIMSASDYQDAHLRLLKLKLKKVQELEIPKVLIRCSSSEQSYNPYYTLIAKKLCGDRKIKMAFQFSLWDLFKRMGETDGDDDDKDTEGDSDELATRSIVNLAKMYGTLIAQGSLGLGVLKNLDLSYLQPKTSTFLEVLFITIFLQIQLQSHIARDESAVVKLFTRLIEAPQLIRGLQYFLRRVVSKSDISGGRDEKTSIKWGCKIAVNVLRDLSASETRER